MDPLDGPLPQAQLDARCHRHSRKGNLYTLLYSDPYVAPHGSAGLNKNKRTLNNFNQGYLSLLQGGISSSPISGDFSFSFSSFTKQQPPFSSTLASREFRPNLTQVHFPGTDSSAENQNETNSTAKNMEQQAAAAAAAPPSTIGPNHHKKRKKRRKKRDSKRKGRQKVDR